MGKTLNVMASHYDDPRYDRMNTGKYTSNGETFDANNPARVSSSEFPDGTELLIRNPENGLASHVKVNDFGPFYRDRTLDVTRRVARDLGFVKLGVTALEVTVIAEPRGDEASYRRNRVMQPALGHLGLVEAEDVPDAIQELLKRAEPKPEQIAASAAPELSPDVPGRGGRPLSSAVEALVRATPLPEPSVPQFASADPRIGTIEIRAAAAGTEIEESFSGGNPAGQRVAMVEALSADVAPLLTTETRGLPQLAMTEPRLRWKSKESHGAIGVLAAGMGQPDLLLFIKMSLLTTLLASAAWGVSERRATAGAGRAPQRQGALGADRRPRRTEDLLEPASTSRPALQLVEPHGPGLDSDAWHHGPDNRSVDIWRFVAGHSLIGDGITIEGSVVSKGQVVIAGTVRGWVAAHEVVILPGGCVEGQAEAGRMEIGGSFMGCLIAGSVRVTSSGALQGDVLTSMIAVEEGGVFEATCRHKDAAPSLAAPEPDFPVAA